MTIAPINDALDDVAFLDPLHFAMASRDADVLNLVRDWHSSRLLPLDPMAGSHFTKGLFGLWTLLGA